MAVEIRTEHPYIVKVPGVCGGAATIRGTRVPVWVLAGYAHQGRTAAELQQLYPQLSLAQLYDALSYWQDHPDEIEADLAVNAGP